jgi:hypothetical protein
LTSNEKKQEFKSSKRRQMISTLVKKIKDTQRKNCLGFSRDNQPQGLTKNEFTSISINIAGRVASMTEGEPAGTE